MSTETDTFAAAQTPRKEGDGGATYRSTSAAVPLGSRGTEPSVRGEGMLRALDRLFLRAGDAVESVLPASLNPLAWTGAVAATSFFIATATGVLLLFWYSPSVHQAYDSVEAMRESPFSAQLLRSLHRYSSDACMLFTLLHTLRILAARRFGGARTLAWITGVAALGMLWLDGWTGYWLVWDERGQEVAVRSSEMLDALPVLAEPMSRSFVTDDGINSLVFFTVFFLHMLIPLGIGVALWLHLSRLSRPKLLTKRSMTLALLAVLVAVSLVFSVSSTAPARMQVIPGDYDLDLFYLAPLAVFDSLGPWAVWGIAAGAGLLLTALPWLLVKRGKKEKAGKPEVVELRCNACSRCYEDCPYGAISMAPRSDDSGRKAAHIDPDKCVVCGICVGSCDPVGISFPQMPGGEVRARLDRWLTEDERAGRKPLVAFICAESAGGGYRIEPESGRCEELPGYRVAAVPCAGWVHPTLLELVTKRGGRTLVVGCGGTEPHYRLGSEWIKQRLEGERAPALRKERVKAEDFAYVECDAGRSSALARKAETFRQGDRPEVSCRGSRAAGVVLTVLVLGLLTGLTVLLGSARFLPMARPEAELVISVRHAGVLVEPEVKAPEPDASAGGLDHMRGAPVRPKHERRTVRIRVTVDGETVLETSCDPRGITGRGPSVGIEYLPVAEGKHLVRVEVGETDDPEEWTHVFEEVLEFGERERRVVLFDGESGFEWR